jgi:hypothetical protein
MMWYKPLYPEQFAIRTGRVPRWCVHRAVKSDEAMFELLVATV